MHHSSSTMYLQSMMIHYFEEGIRDSSLISARNSFLVNGAVFPNFDSILNMYVTSKRGQKSAETPHQGRNLSAISWRRSSWLRRGRPRWSRSG
jgi:hypothetical protein